MCNCVPAEVCLGRFVESEQRHLESQQLIQREARATKVQCQASTAILNGNPASQINILKGLSAEG